MDVLVLGATGYVGRHVVKRLVKGGHRVTGFIRSKAQAASLAEAGARHLAGTLDDMSQMVSALAPFDAVLWIAQLMLEDEARVVTALLNGLAGTGKTFVFTGGTSLISERTDGAWSENTFAEDDAFVPRRQIAPRLDIENKVREANGAGLRTLCIRPPLIWGNGTCKIISDMYHSARETGAVCYMGAGLNCYSNVHVDDLAEVYALALEKGIGGALYHSVSGEVNYRQMAETIAGHLGVPTRSIGFEEAVELWDKFTALIVFGSCSRSRSPRARDELGWLPRADRLDLLAECLNPIFTSGASRNLSSWVRSNGAG
ncbi:NAD-dependent epimerase/dehydratase family protein [Novosphingobium sp. G106]|uniref:NAD-dependent epimerase/dehydratase family protein n=1 Tax=Novosphingobium sp. G106 TaxID=2849500 RepID=UPI001C2D56D1|nr:NAD-dependent epimerase/dehydratase family protein [Novosphingobium sp. G106]MBV1686455.1 NAD-dependent epimerase/dehydratase family protein [Novosphingobium sp. G106]